MKDKYYIPYFSRQELACKRSGNIVLAEGFAEKLVELRTRFNKPMPVTSGCRSREHNRNVGGTPNSFHIYDYPRYGFTGTCAVDIATKDNTFKEELKALAWQMGWSIGVNKSFLHLDRRIDYTNLPQIVFKY